MELLDEDNVLAILSEQVQRAGGQTAWAKKFGINRTDVTNALRKRRCVSNAALDALGLKRVVRYANKSEKYTCGLLLGPIFLCLSPHRLTGRVLHLEPVGRTWRFARPSMVAGQAR